MTRNERWILSEWRVACDRTLNHRERLVAHRQRTPFAEVDLLLESPGGLSLVEVKTWRRELWASDVISARQARRLARARLHLESRFQKPTRLLLAVVELEQERIRYFEGWAQG